jgi:predicted nucleic acid-binding Zn ribbon protein
MTATRLACAACGTELPPDAKFCNECGEPITSTSKPAEYKQVTVLFADVVHSMDIAVAVGAERLREIMTELVNRAGRVVHRFGGAVDKFTGDGIMAVFGAPVALEDHAFRACLAALDIQREAAMLTFGGTTASERTLPASNSPKDCASSLSACPTRAAPAQHRGKPSPESPAQPHCPSHSTPGH